MLLIMMGVTGVTDRAGVKCFLNLARLTGVHDFGDVLFWISVLMVMEELFISTVLRSLHLRRMIVDSVSAVRLGTVMVERYMLDVSTEFHWNEIVAVVVRRIRVCLFSMMH
jgi:hypothetical protein